jgi:DNA replication protein DnaC
MQDSGMKTEVFDINSEIERRKNLTADEKAEQDRKDAEAAKAARARERANWYGSANLEYLRRLAADVPVMYQGRRLDELRPTDANKEALTAARDWLLTAEDNLAAGRGMWLVGPPGCGKTAILTAMLYTLPTKADLWRGRKQRQLTVKYVNWAQFICESNLRTEREDTYKLEQAMKHADILVMDDVGAEQNSKLSRALAYAVIDHRCANRQPIFVASNLKPNELAQAIGDREVDRLHQICPKQYRRTIVGDSFRAHPEQLEING